MHTRQAAACAAPFATLNMPALPPPPPCACLQFSNTLCNSNGPYPTDTSSKLCHYLPVVQEQIDLVINTLLWCNGCISALALGAACAGSWHFWELAYVEKKAAKHKRRRKQRKNSIPWDKIKVGAG